MPNTKTNRDGLLVTENVRIFLMKTDGNGPGAAGKESVMNLLGMRSLGKIKEKGEKIMFWIELVIMLLLIFWGVRKGGVFLTLAGAVGAFVFTFIFKSPMSDPPLTVLRIILAVVIAGGAMQAAGGIEYLVALAEKILRKHPRSITILAPMISWLLFSAAEPATFCGACCPSSTKLPSRTASVPSGRLPLLWFPAKMRSAALRLPPLPPRW